MAKRKNKKNSKRKTSALKALASTALGLQTMASPGLQIAEAQTVPDAPTLRFQYVDYFDYQEDVDRMRVKGPLFNLETPIGEKTALESTFIIDSVSGASPLYLDTVSGASGSDIDDFRKAGDATVTHYFDRFSLGVGGNFSDEEDYRSIGGTLTGQVWTADKNTVFTMSFAGADDDIAPTNNTALRESNRSLEYLLGLTQVINQNSLIQLNLTFSSGDGYHSDPYKPFDDRPRSRDVFAALARYNAFFPDLGSSLHTDYRFAHDSWNLNSHLFELAWYQPLGEIWTIRPNIRYYTQNEADFFRPFFPPIDSDSFYSADQRLSAFGSISAGLMAYVDVGSGFTLQAGVEFMKQRSDYRLGSNGTEGIEAFYARMLTFGVTKKF